MARGGLRRKLSKAWNSSAYGSDLQRFIDSQSGHSQGISKHNWVWTSIWEGKGKCDKANDGNLQLEVFWQLRLEQCCLKDEHSVNWGHLRRSKSAFSNTDWALAQRPRVNKNQTSLQDIYVVMIYWCSQSLWTFAALWGKWCVTGA